MWVVLGAGVEIPLVPPFLPARGTPVGTPLPRSDPSAAKGGHLLYRVSLINRPTPRMRPSHHNLQLSIIC